MSVSLEALAMSGANYLEVGFDINEWEQMESEVPPHLLADEEEENVEEEKKKIERKKVDQEYSGRSLFCSSYNTEDCYGGEQCNVNETNDRTAVAPLFALRLTLNRE
ncbi:hypothetical protein ABFS82_12G013600 [Erythranthe guttata]